MASVFVRFHLAGYTDTLYFVGMFMVGALLAKNHEIVIRKFNCLNNVIKITLIGLSLLIYTYILHIPLQLTLLQNIVFRWGVTLSVALFITLSLSSSRVSKVLKGKVIHFLGKISYSLYLYHLIITVTLINILYWVIPLWVILLLSFATSLIVATMSYYLIEIPAIGIGKHMSQIFLKPNIFDRKFMNN